MRVEGRANSPYVCRENYCGKRPCDTEQKMRFSWNQNGLLSKCQPRGLLRRGDLEILRMPMLVSVFWIKNVWRTGCGLKRLTAEQFRRRGHSGIHERQENPGSTCRVRTWLLDKGLPSVHHICTNDWQWLSSQVLRHQELWQSVHPGGLHRACHNPAGLSILSVL